jgi:hypothetical protein
MGLPSLGAGMRIACFTVLLAFLLSASGGDAPARTAGPVFAADFDTVCLGDDDWQVSGRLAKSTQADRIHCVAGLADGRALAVTVRPGDAYDPNPGSTPTERVELQLRREVVRFDATTWYSFRFRTMSPWPTQRNRTVIQQIKQNIDPLYEKGRGQQEICDPANPLFKIEVDSDGTSPVFRAKVAGAEGCGDSVGQQRICGDWPIAAEAWHRVNVMILPSQRAGGSHLQLWLDGRACPVFDGVLGYPRYGVTRDGRPVIDTQPRFGIYRDALPTVSQTILFDDIRFWSEPPEGYADWAGIDLAPRP